MHDLRMVAPAVCAWATAAAVVNTSPMLGVGLCLAGLGLAGLGSVGQGSVAQGSGAHLTTGRRIRTLVLLVALSMSGVAAVTTWRMTAISHSPVHRLAADRSLVTVDALVSRDARSFEVHGSRLVIVEATVKRVASRTESFVDRAPVTVFVEGASSGRAARLQMGERFTALGRFAPAEVSNRAAELTVIRLGPVRVQAWWWDASSHMRASVAEAVSRTGAEPAALIPALVHGDDQRLDETVKDDFRRSGLTHLLAVSGTNLTIVLVTLLLVGRTLGIRRRGQWLLGALSVVGFILLARPDPSVLRAAAMGSVGLAGLGYGTRGGVRALSWAIIALLLIDPWLSGSLGFILSVCATAGILFLAPPMTRALTGRIPHWAAVAIAVPIAAQLACTPVIAAISGQVSLVAVLANILAGPAVAPATVLGLLGGAVGLVYVPASHVVGVPAGWCGRWILAVGHWSAGLPGASVTWSGPLWLLGLLCLVAAAMLLWLGARPGLLLGLSLGLAVCLWRPPSPGWPPPGWVMVACDVGQGDTTVLNAGDGQAVVVDSGPEPAAVDRCLQRLDVEHIPLMVFTHGHADHIGGWDGVRRHRRVGQVMIGPTGGPGGGLPRHEAVPGESFTIGALGFVVLGPADSEHFAVEGEEGSAANNASIVLLVTVRGLRILMSGDAEPQAQDAILAGGYDVHADVLKMPHHGSARQSERFFAAVGARVATISDGKGNDYGHPAPAALALLKRLHIATYRTDTQGDIALTVHDGRLEVVTR